MVLLQALIVGRVVLDKFRPLFPGLRRARIHAQPGRSSRMLSAESRDYFLSRRRVAASPFESRNRQKKATVYDEEWIPIYRFKLIPVVAILSRLKLYQTVFVSVFLVPGMCALRYQNHVSVEVFQTSLGIGIFSLLMLYIMTSFSQKLIGVVSVGKMSHPNMRGRFG